MLLDAFDSETHECTVDAMSGSWYVCINSAQCKTKIVEPICRLFDGINDQTG
jgi:hypothetical protein